MVATGRLCRTQVNRRIVRLRAMFRWAVGEELIPSPIVEAQRSLEPLRRGRTEGNCGVKPASPDWMAAVSKRTLRLLIRRGAPC